MKKQILISALIIANTVAFADNTTSNYLAFQQFDNKISVGISATQATLANGAHNQSLQQSQFMALDAEYQFNNGIWANLNAFMMTGTTSLGSLATGTGMGSGMPASQEPNVGGFNSKIGYSFLYTIKNENFMVTPYGIIGRNTNLAMSTIMSNGQSNVTNDYYLTGGLGGRLQYNLNKYVNLYLDQSWTYNWDKSNPINGIMPQDNQIFTTTLGTKLNVWKSLQIGAGIFYNNYQYVNAAPAIATVNGGTNQNGTTVSIYQQQYSVGGNISVGMTF